MPSRRTKRQTAPPPRPHGTCSECGDQWVIRLDGMLRAHGPHPFGPGQWECPGSHTMPVEGVLMDCVWCNRLFLSGDDAHRFCSEVCVKEWENEDGSWDGWDLAPWLQKREERSR